VCKRPYSSTLKMEAIFSSETSVDFQRTTQRYIPEASTPHDLCCIKLSGGMSKFGDR
jgi:hypothetical protein